MADPEAPPSQDPSIKNEQLTEGEINHQCLKRKLDTTESDTKTTENESPCKTTDNITPKPIWENESSTKKPRIETPDTEVSSPDSDKLSKKELQRIERQQQRDLERIEKEKKKEEERLRKQDERIKRQEAKDLEKESKRKKLEEEKLQRERKKEEERLEREQKKEEERIKKQIEKDEKEKLRLSKKRQLDEEKESKEIERKKAEEEKKRAEELKERNQKKISSFFQVGRKVTSPQKSSSSRFVESTNVDDDLTSYEKDFLPFFIKKNVKMASSGQLDEQQLRESKKYLDNVLKTPLRSQLKDFFLSIKPQPSVVVSSITPEDIITALNSPNSTEAQIYDMLQKIPPIKYISFYENSKPAFIGTWCSANHQQIKLPTSDPTNSSLTGFDYDYDSDLEWNKEDEEGEDLDEDEEEEDDLIVPDEDDIDDFVENNAETTTKKFHSLVVINKWNDGTNDEIFGGMTTTSIISEVAFPMDPFHDYWNKKEEAIPEIVAIPLKLGSETAPNTPQKKSTPNILTPQKKTIKDPAIIAGLIQFIETNQEFTLGTLVELSKKEFKDFTKALLKNTIQDIATYNKKTSNWDVKEEIKKKYQVTERTFLEFTPPSSTQ